MNVWIAHTEGYSTDVANLIKLNLSSRRVEFKPDDVREFARTKDFPEAGDFEVTVVNTSSRFVSFQLELIPQGVESYGGAQWYRVDPSVSAKKPPGDRTTFHITLLRSPVPTYDVTLPVTLRVFSADVENLIGEDTLWIQVVRPNRTLHVYLPLEELSVYPGERLHIPALVYNLSPKARQVTLHLKGLDPLWFPEGTQQTVQVDAGDSFKGAFWCAPPATGESLCRHYPVQLEGAVSTEETVVNQQNTDSAFGKVIILPFGEIQLRCLKHQQWVPPQQSGWTRKRWDMASFDLRLLNRSNVTARMGFPVTIDNPDIMVQPIAPLSLAPNPESEGKVAVEVQAKRPWWGLTRTHFLTVAPTICHDESGENAQAIVVQPPSQILELKIRPVVPLLLQIAGGLLGLFLLWLAWLMNPGGRHAAPVNGLTLMANGSTVVSGSSDGELRRWQVRQDSWLPAIRRLQPEGVLQDENHPINKAIRTLRHLPSEVKQTAVGLENGEIQIWDISPAQFRRSFFEQGKPDRVFALDFTADSHFLFSGHGSGMVRLWDMERESVEPEQRLFPTGGSSFAIAALKVVESSSAAPFVAVGGQFNRLVLWDWKNRQAYNLSYTWKRKQTTFAPVISRQNYVTSLASAPERLIASADNQGFITLWNTAELTNCMSRVSQRTIGQQPLSAGDSFGTRYHDIHVMTDCSPSVITDQWQASNSSAGIRSMALTENGCYLASAGDDGRAVLWPLTAEGKRDPDTHHKILAQATSSLNSIDIHYTRQDNREVVLVVSDTPQYQVRLYRESVNSHGCE